jgi:hypothetical protein
MKTKYIPILLISVLFGMAIYAFMSARKTNPDGLGAPSAAMAARTASAIVDDVPVAVAATPADAAARPGRRVLSLEERKKMNRSNFKNQIAERRRGLDKNYGDLFKRLNLPEQKLAILKDLLVDHELSGRMAGVSLMDSEEYAKTGRTSNEEVSRQAEQYRNEAKANMRELLGDNDYSYTLRYLDTLGERIQVNEFKSSIKGTTETLTQEQTEALVDILYDSRKPLRAQNYDEHDRVSIVRFRGQYAVENATAFLTQFQLAALRSFYEEKVERQASGIWFSY